MDMDCAFNCFYLVGGFNSLERYESVSLIIPSERLNVTISETTTKSAMDVPRSISLFHCSHWHRLRSPASPSAADQARAQRRLRHLQPQAALPLSDLRGGEPVLAKGDPMGSQRL